MQRLQLPQAIESKTITLRLIKDKDLIKNMSATVVIGDDIWLASDEKMSVEKLVKKDEHLWELKESFNLSTRIALPVTGEKDNEIDIEGMDYKKGHFWVVGSHSSKRKKAKSGNPTETIANLQTVEREGNRFVLAKFALSDGKLAEKGASLRALDKDVAPYEKLKASSSPITDLLQNDPHLSSFLAIPSKDNGFDIEGLAVSGKRVFLGLRGPVLRGVAIVLEIEVDVATDDPTVLKLKELETSVYIKKHFLDLKGLGVRDLCFLGEDLLVLAGPTMQHDGTISVFRWKNATTTGKESFQEPEKLFDIPHGEGTNRAEGLTIFSKDADSVSLLVICDSPSEDNLDGKDGLKANIIKIKVN